MSLGLNSFINAQGFGKTGMLTVVIGAVLNIIFRPDIYIYNGRTGCGTCDSLVTACRIGLDV